jgi:hypothetical protein
MSEPTVAEIILQQLGGRRFITMTGARDFMGGPDFLSFRLPGPLGFCKQGINHVKITLTPMDVYTVQFNRIRGTIMVPISTRQDVYAEDLEEVFTTETGLRTRLN